VRSGARVNVVFFPAISKGAIKLGGGSFIESLEVIHSMGFIVFYFNSFLGFMCFSCFLKLFL
jgi:hypothetical protein